MVNKKKTKTPATCNLKPATCHLFHKPEPLTRVNGSHRNMNQSIPLINQWILHMGNDNTFNITFHCNGFIAKSIRNRTHQLFFFLPSPLILFSIGKYHFEMPVTILIG